MNILGWMLYRKIELEILQSSKNRIIIQLRVQDKLHKCNLKRGVARKVPGRQEGWSARSHVQEGFHTLRIEGQKDGI